MEEDLPALFCATFLLLRLLLLPSANKLPIILPGPLQSRQSQPQLATIQCPPQKPLGFVSPLLALCLVMDFSFKK